MAFKISGKVIFGMLFLVGAFVACNTAKKQEEENRDSENSAEKGAPKIETISDLPAFMAKGQKIYVQNCLVCHQANGKGVSGLNPPINNSDYVVGDTDRLLGILLKESNEGLVVQGTTYSNAMPGFETLNDTAIAHVASYIRNSFGNSADSITISQVAKFRASEDP